MLRKRNTGRYFFVTLCQNGTRRPPQPAKMADPLNHQDTINKWLEAAYERG